MDWFGPDVGTSNATQKQAVLLLLRSLLELSFACSAALACSCSVNVGTFLVTGPACWRAWTCCGRILSSGRFLFVSVIVVCWGSLLWTPEGMALKHALV